MLDPHKKPWPYQKVNTAHPLAKGLVGCFLFNERSGNIANDSSRNLNTGTITGANWDGGTLKFNGTTTYVITPHNQFDKDIGTFISSFSHDVASSDATLRWLFDSDGTRHSIWRDTAGVTHRINSYVDGRGGIFNIPDYGANSWHHIAFMWNKHADTLNCYWDGVEIPETPLGSFATTALGTNLHLGARYTNNNLWNGAIEYIFLYNRELTGSEVQTLKINPYQMLEPVFNEVLFGYVAPVAGGLSIPIAYHHYRQLHGN